MIILLQNNPCTDKNEGVCVKKEGGLGSYDLSVYCFVLFFSLNV